MPQTRRTPELQSRSLSHQGAICHMTTPFKNALKLNDVTANDNLKCDSVGKHFESPRTLDNNFKGLQCISEANESEDTTRDSAV